MEEIDIFWLGERMVVVAAAWDHEKPFANRTL